MSQPTEYKPLYLRMLKIIFPCISKQEQNKPEPCKLVTSASQYEIFPDEDDIKSYSYNPFDEPSTSTTIHKSEVEIKESLKKLDTLITTLDNIFQLYSKDNCKSRGSEDTGIEEDVVASNSSSKSTMNLESFSNSVIDHIISLKTEIEELKSVLLAGRVDFASGSPLSNEGIRTSFDNKENIDDKWVLREEEYKFFEAKLRAANFCKFHKLASNCDKKTGKKVEGGEIECLN